MSVEPEEVEEPSGCAHGDGEASETPRAKKGPSSKRQGTKPKRNWAGFKLGPQPQKLKLKHPEGSEDPGQTQFYWSDWNMSRGLLSSSGENTADTEAPPHSDQVGTISSSSIPEGEECDTYLADQLQARCNAGSSTDLHGEASLPDTGGLVVAGQSPGLAGDSPENVGAQGDQTRKRKGDGAHKCHLCQNRFHRKDYVTRHIVACHSNDDTTTSLMLNLAGTQAWPASSPSDSQDALEQTVEEQDHASPPSTRDQKMTLEEFRSVRPAANLECHFHCNICKKKKPLSYATARKHLKGHSIKGKISGDFTKWHLYLDALKLKGRTGEPLQFEKLHNDLEMYLSERAVGHGSSTSAVVPAGLGDVVCSPAQGGSFDDDEEETLDYEQCATKGASDVASHIEDHPPVTQAHDDVGGGCATQGGKDSFESQKSLLSPPRGIHSQEFDQAGVDSGAICFLIAKLNSMESLLSEQAKAGKLEVETFNISVHEECYGWQCAGPAYTDPITNREVKPRNNWPNIQPIQDELTDFQKWVKTERVVGEKGVAQHAFYVRRVLSLLVVPPGVQHSSIEVVVSMYKTDVIRELMTLPMMSRDLPWSRKCATATGFYAKYHMSVANQSGMYVVASVCSALLGVLEGWSARASVAHKQALRARGEYDASRLGCLPSIPKLKMSAQRAMELLSAIGAKYTGCISMDSKDHEMANWLMAGVLHLVTYAGRVGTWVLLLRAAMLTTLANGESFLVCRDHKNKVYYGDISKYLPECLRKAFECYLGLPLGNKDKGLCFAPVSSAASYVEMYKLLVKYSTYFFPGEQHLTSNLIRKLFHVHFRKISMNEDLVFGIYQDMGEHSRNVGKKIYAFKTARDDAELGRIAYKHVFGAFLVWPKPDLIAIGQSIAALALVPWEEQEHIQEYDHDLDPDELDSDTETGIEFCVGHPGYQYEAIVPLDQVVAIGSPLVHDDGAGPVLAGESKQPSSRRRTWGSLCRPQERHVDAVVEVQHTIQGHSYDMHNPRQLPALPRRQLRHRRSLSV